MEKGHAESFQGDGRVLCLDLGGVYMDAYLFLKKSTNYAVKICAVYCMQVISQ